jgi:hypothetical protein
LEILVGGIQAWLSLEPFDERVIPLKYARLLREQRIIGCGHNFFRVGCLLSGHFSKTNITLDFLPLKAVTVLLGPVIFCAMSSPNGCFYGILVMQTAMDVMLLLKMLLAGPKQYRNWNNSIPAKIQFSTAIEPFSSIPLQTTQPNRHTLFGSRLIPTNP